MKSALIALRQRKHDLAAKASGLLDRANADGRELSSAEAAEWSTLAAQLHTIEASLIVEEEKLEQQKRSVAVPDENAMFARRAGVYNPNAGSDMEQGQSSFKATPTRKKFKDLFGEQCQSSGFRNFSEYLRAVHFSGQVYDPRLKAGGLQAGATETVPSDGGFLVPSEFSQTIIDEALEDECVRPNAWVYPMKFDTLKVPAVQDNDHSNATLYGGVTANWTSEAGELATQKVKMRMIQLSAHKLGMISAASNELIEDSTFESILGAKLTAGASWHLDRAFLFGDGAGKPLGILSPSNPALVTVPKEDTQTADQVVLENILKMYGAMAPRNRKRAIWVFNDGLVPALYAIANRIFNLAASEVVGGSSAGVIFFMNSDGSATLLGRPVIFSEKLSEPGDLGDALFCDFTAYAIGLRREILLQKSWHAGFSTDESFYRLTCRIDGQPTWNAPLKLLDGTLRSPYVTLAARE